MSVLSRHTIATWRTLEQKISDAGPYNQRVDPHVLTEARSELLHEDRIIRKWRKNAPWFHLHDTAPAEIQRRLDEQGPIHDAIVHQNFTKRAGQAGEITVYRALLKQDQLESFGRFTDLCAHDDSIMYRKEEPPGGIGANQIPDDRKVDFLVRHPVDGWAAIEVKNIREWIYPDRSEITDLLEKSLHLDAVPVLIARRIPYVTRRVLTPCGVIVWQTYNQRYPETEEALANQARNKNLLGFHDIRLGNDPSPQLNDFFARILPEELAAARDRFAAYRDLLEHFTFGGMEYQQFAARARRREAGTNEDHDWPDDPDEVF